MSQSVFRSPIRRSERASAPLGGSPSTGRPAPTGAHALTGSVAWAVVLVGAALAHGTPSDGAIASPLALLAVMTALAGHLIRYRGVPLAERPAAPELVLLLILGALTTIPGLTLLDQWLLTGVCGIAFGASLMSLARPATPR